LKELYFSETKVTGSVLPVEQPGRLRLGELVARRAAGPQVREGVRPAGVGVRDQADRLAEVVGAGQGGFRVADAALADTNAAGGRGRLSSRRRFSEAA
jgi:hypothetical protein